MLKSGAIEIIFKSHEPFQSYVPAKGQLISICLFGVFNSFPKTNKNKSTWGIIVVKSNSFVRFLEESLAWQFAFEINWHLVPKNQSESAILKFGLRFKDWHDKKDDF